MANANLYTVPQQKALALVPLISGIPSLLGSGLVLLIILRDWKKKMGRVYHRLLFGYSIMNSLVTLSMICGFLLMPKGSIWGARGTDLTCSFQGAIYNMTFASVIYVTSIAMYYFLILCLQLTEQFIARYIESFCHFMAIIYPALINIGALKRLLYSPLMVNRGYCWFKDVPFGCTDDPGVPCERGEGAEAYKFAGITLISYVCVPIVITSMTVIYVHVRKKLLLSSGPITSNLYMLMKLRDTRNQCFLYLFAYTFVTMWALVLEMYGSVPEAEVNVQMVFPLVILSKLALASGGIWNALIYMRPRFVSLRRRFPTVSAWYIHKSIILDTYQPIRSGLRRQQDRAASSTDEESFFRSTVWGSQVGREVSSSPGGALEGQYLVSDESSTDDFIPEIIYIAFNDQSNTDAGSQNDEPSQSVEVSVETSSENQQTREDLEISENITEREIEEIKGVLATQSDEGEEHNCWESQSFGHGDVISETRSEGCLETDKAIKTKTPLRASI